MRNLLFGTFITVFTTLPFILRYFLKQRYEKLSNKLKEHDDGSYYQCIFFGARNFSCKPHFIERKDCGNSCSYTQLQRILHYMNSAKKSISLCMYTLTLKQVQSTLIQLSQKGVEVRIITDKVMNKTKISKDIFGDFKKKGIEFKMPQSTDQLMHHKYCLIDEADKEHAKAFFGSVNLTSQAMCKNFEALILTNNWKIIQRLSEEFEELWNIFGSQ